MPTASLVKNERIDVCASTPVKRLLQEAARPCHTNVGEFLSDAGVNAASQALADRRQFALNPEQWDEFRAALDRPVKANPRLKRLPAKPDVPG